jgi:polyisoprenoid-binding protein YceI
MWLDAEKYPVIQFTSSAITKTNSGYEQKEFLDLHVNRKTFTSSKFTVSINRFILAISDSTSI